MKTLIVVLIAATAALITADQQNNFSRNLIRTQNDKSADSSAESSSNSRESWLTDSQASKSVSFEEFKANPQAFEADLRSNGIWVERNSSQELWMPREAVYAGYEANNTLYVMRAGHTDDSGVFVGRFLGKYAPRGKFAYITYNGKEYMKNDFEIFLHTSHVWTAKSDPRELIPGGNSEYFCRFEVDHLEFWTPGRLDGQQTVCRVPYYGEKASNSFEILKNACSGSKTAPSDSTEPRIAPYEDVVEHPDKYQQDLSGNGVWVLWNNKKVGVPSNAVYGGFRSSGPIFLILADHSTPTGNIRIPGVYYPAIRKAYVDYGHQVYEKEMFDVMIHNGYTWRERNSNADYIEIYRQNYCLGYTDKGLFLTPGRYDPSVGYCYLIEDGKVMGYDMGFLLLARSC